MGSLSFGDTTTVKPFGRTTLVDGICRATVSEAKAAPVSISATRRLTLNMVSHRRHFNDLDSLFSTPSPVIFHPSIAYPAFGGLIGTIVTTVRLSLVR